MRTTKKEKKLKKQETPKHPNNPQKNDSYYNEDSTMVCDQAPRERQPRRAAGRAAYVPPTSRQAAEYSLTAHSRLLAWRSPEGETEGGRGEEGEGGGVQFSQFQRQD